MALAVGGLLLSAVLAAPISAQSVHLSSRSDTLTVGQSSVVDIVIDGQILRAHPVNALQFIATPSAGVVVDSVGATGIATGWTVFGNQGRVAAANLGAQSLVLGGAVIRMWLTATKSGGHTITLSEILLNGGIPTTDQATYTIDLVADRN